MASTTSTAPIKKRIILCCDGTWMDSDNEAQVPSNVTRIARCIKPEGFDKTTNQPIPQVIHYNPGVGTGDSWYSRFVGGGTGAGLAEHIRTSYSFVCDNYNDGDEIFIIGFSRGAFTARSVSSLISAIGLLTPHYGMAYMNQIIDDWEYQLNHGWKSPFPDEPWPNRAPFDLEKYRQRLREEKMSRLGIKIKCVAVWDTVGALGIPMVRIFPQPASKDFSFVNTKVDDNIEYAFHALGLDERRRSYAPTIWEKPDHQEWPKVLKQTWFPGVHSDIGGSYTNNDLANITLAWMVSQLDPLLDFDESYVQMQYELSIKRHEKKHQPVREWGLGKIHNSMTPFFKLGGQKIRTPGEYTQPDAQQLRPWVVECFRYWLRVDDKPGAPLKNTNEHFHSSVRIRMGLKGRGYGDEDGTMYKDLLKDWVMHGVEVSPSQMTLSGDVGTMKRVVWKKKVMQPRPKGQGTEEMTIEMPEDEIGGLERSILDMWPELSHNFESIQPGGHETNIKRPNTYPGDDPSSKAPVGGGNQ